MEVRISNHQKLIGTADIRKISRQIIKAWQPPEGEVSLLIVGDQEIAGYNQQYRNRRGPTNVLAFPLKEGLYSEINPQLWGDVVISTETALREAQEAGLTLTERFQFLLVHGLLHLMGYDHERSESEAQRMEAKTEEIMARMKGSKKEE